MVVNLRCDMSFKHHLPFIELLSFGGVSGGVSGWLVKLALCDLWPDLRATSTLMFSPAGTDSVLVVAILCVKGENEALGFFFKTDFVMSRLWIWKMKSRVVS